MQDWNKPPEVYGIDKDDWAGLNLSDEMDSKPPTIRELLSLVPAFERVALEVNEDPEFLEGLLQERKIQVNGLALRSTSVAGVPSALDVKLQFGDQLTINGVKIVISDSFSCMHTYS